MFSKFMIIVSILGISFQAGAQAKSDSIRCEETDVTQFIPLKGEVLSPKVRKFTIVASRLKTSDGEKEIFKTEGQRLDDKGKIDSNYTNVRKTKKVTLSETSYREISDFENTSTSVNPDIQPQERKTTYQMINDYQLQPDGNYLIVKQYKDGVDVTGTDGVKTVVAANGDKYEMTWSTSPQYSPTEDGDYKIISFTQVCVTKSN